MGNLQRVAQMGTVPDWYISQSIVYVSHMAQHVLLWQYLCNSKYFCLIWFKTLAQWSWTCKYYPCHFYESMHGKCVKLGNITQCPDLVCLVQVISLRTKMYIPKQSATLPFSVALWELPFLVAVFGRATKTGSHWKPPEINKCLMSIGYYQKHFFKHNIF